MSPSVGMSILALVLECEYLRVILSLGVSLFMTVAYIACFTALRLLLRNTAMFMLSMSVQI